MHKTVKNLLNIQSKVKQNLVINNLMEEPNIIAVSKTFNLDHIKHLIDHGHLHYGENKVQEAIEKWSEIKKQKSSIQLHLIGKLQTNKVKFAVKLFDYIHSLDNEKLAKKISSLQKIENKNLKIFIQVNIGEENQKSGIHVSKLTNFYTLQRLKFKCGRFDVHSSIDGNTHVYFKKMQELKKQFNFKDLSMGMSSDYLDAFKYNASFLGGSSIFGNKLSLILVFFLLT